MAGWFSALLKGAGNDKVDVFPGDDLIETGMQMTDSVPCNAGPWLLQASWACSPQLLSCPQSSLGGEVQKRLAATGTEVPFEFLAFSSA